MGYVSEKYPRGVDETVNLHYLDRGIQPYVPVSTDQQLTVMFGCFKYMERGEVCISVIGCNQ